MDRGFYFLGVEVCLEYFLFFSEIIPKSLLNVSLFHLQLEISTQSTLNGKISEIVLCSMYHILRTFIWIMNSYAIFKSYTGFLPCIAFNSISL